MAVTKKSILIKIITLLVILFFIIFPFGQLLRMDSSFFGKEISLPLIDVVAAFSLFPAVLLYGRKFKAYRLLFGLFLVLFFSFFLSLINFGPINVLTGSMYLLRLVSYFSFSACVYYLLKKGYYKKYLSGDKLLVLLVILICFIAFMGWLQYIFIPDLRSLYHLGWDDHLYRLAGTFLDPGYTGILLSAGALLSQILFSRKRETVYLLVAVFLIVTLAFTYSRASYIAFFAGVIYLYWNNLKKILVYSFIALLITVIILPRPAGYGVRLERTHSIISKYENYRETFKIFSHYPLFGVGYNNICLAREMLNTDTKTYGTHSCSGSDSSMLMVMATTGIVGTMIFAGFIFSLLKRIGKSEYKKYFLAVFIAVAVHSMFLNSMFYAWIMGMLAVLYAVSLSGTKDYK